MATEARETENKYEFRPGAVLPFLGDLPGVAQESDLAEQKLEAEYYDTSDLLLVRAGVTLRRRSGGGDAGWHLKLPLAAGAHREIRLPLGRPSRRVPALTWPARTRSASVSCTRAASATRSCTTTTT